MTTYERVSRILEITSTLLVIVAALAVLGTLGNRYYRRPAKPAQTNFVGLTIESSRVRHAMGEGRIAIVEFADFQCPFCGKFARKTLPELESQFVKNGTARYIAFHYPIEAIHPYALRAGQAAECAGAQGRFWEMHARLFSEDVSLTETDLRQHATAIGLEKDEFNACMADDQVLEHVRADQAEGKRLGVAGTPTFFLGTVESSGAVKLRARIVGNADAEAFSREIAKLRSDL